MRCILKKSLLLVAALAVGSGASLLGPGPSPAAARAGQAPPATTVPVTTAPVTTAPVTSAPGVDQGCDALVHDPSRALGDGPEVVAAIGRLLDQGVEIRVRVQSELPEAEAVTALEETCGWLVDGQRSDESMLLVVVPGTDEAGLWYGDGLRARIGARFAQLRTDLSSEAVAPAKAVAMLLDGLAFLAATEDPADPLGCDQLVWDPGGVLAGDPAVGDTAMALQAEGNDVRVRVEPSTDGDLDARLAQLEASCPGWQQGGDRPADRLIVMVQPGSRSTGLWYGTDFSDSLSTQWRTSRPRP